jgi:hypothetical protein
VQCCCHLCIILADVPVFGRSSIAAGEPRRSGISSGGPIDGLPLRSAFISEKSPGLPALQCRHFGSASSAWPPSRLHQLSKSWTKKPYLNTVHSAQDIHCHSAPTEQPGCRVLVDWSVGHHSSYNSNRPAIQGASDTMASALDAVGAVGSCAGAPLQIDIKKQPWPRWDGLPTCSWVCCAFAARRPYAGEVLQGPQRCGDLSVLQQQHEAAHLGFPGWLRDGLELQAAAQSFQICWAQGGCASHALDRSLHFQLSKPSKTSPLSMQAGVYSVAFSPTHALIASGSKDRTIRLWQPTV